MEIINSSIDRCFSYEIAIVSSSALPEAMSGFSVWLRVAHLIKKDRRGRLHEPDRLARNRPLYGCQHIGNRIFFFNGVNEYVSVFGHDDISPNFKVKRLTCVLQ